MVSEPARRVVRASPALITQAETWFGIERSASGHPSQADFQQFLVPHLVEAVAVAWDFALPVAGYDGLVRELVIRPHGLFGPARVTCHDDGDVVWLIGFEPDLTWWLESEDPDDDD